MYPKCSLHYAPRERPDKRIDTSSPLRLYLSGVGFWSNGTVVILVRLRLSPFGQRRLLWDYARDKESPHPSGL